MLATAKQKVGVKREAGTTETNLSNTPRQSDMVELSMLVALGPRINMQCLPSGGLLQSDWLPRLKVRSVGYRCVERSATA